MNEKELEFISEQLFNAKIAIAQIEDMMFELDDTIYELEYILKQFLEDQHG